MYSHVARAALRRAMVSPRANPSAARPRTTQIVVYPMMTVTIRHVSTGKDSPFVRVTTTPVGDAPEWTQTTQSESEADIKADHTDVPLRDLTEETIEYVHERYDPAAPASFKTRAVRVKHRKPVPEEWSGERASESEADLKADRSPETASEMTEETIEYVHERYDRKRVVDTPEWDQSRASESEADVKADHTNKPLDELTEETIEFVQEQYDSDAANNKKH